MLFRHPVNEFYIEAAIMAVSLGIILWSVWSIVVGLRIARKQKGLSYVFHGTRLPMSVILEHGIPDLTAQDRQALFDAIAQALADIGIAGLKRDWLTELLKPSISDLKHGVYVCGKYQSARDFAIAAPAFVTDHIYELLRKAGYKGASLDYAFLAILDKIGQPKVLECHMPMQRFLKGKGEYGSVVDKILPEDIVQIHVISYNNPAEASRQQIDRLVNTAMDRWGGNSEGRKELGYVRQGQS